MQIAVVDAPVLPLLGCSDPHDMLHDERPISVNLAIF